MKYGETLQQRSIDKWSTHNIDYNEIKSVIKEHTTQPQTQAISIPGNGEDGPSSDTFEEELFDTLCDQHNRINLFVTSKLGEIQSRLKSAHQELTRLNDRYHVPQRNSISTRAVENFSAIEGRVILAGEELQSLSTFVAVQNLGFIKILKKYKKWSSSARVADRFDKEVIKRPDSLARKDLTLYLSRYSAVLAAVREPFEAGLSWSLTKPQSPHREASSSSGVSSQDYGSGPLRSTIDELRQVHENGSEVDIDTAFATIPFGPRAGHATFWVHKDNLIQVHILVQQDMSIRKSQNTPSLSRTSSKMSLPSDDFLVSDRTGLLVCDDLNRFAKARQSITIKELESSPGRKLEEATACVRYAASEAVVIIDTSISHSRSTHVDPLSIKQAKLKRKHVGQLFEFDEESATRRDSTATNGSGASSSAAIQTVRAWLRSHKEIRPLVRIESNRTRFVGLANTSSTGTWATLDADILMSRSHLMGLEVLGAGSSTSDEFPHALLEFRWEGQKAPELLQKLDKSHLVFRVHGFSLERHAIAALYKPANMSKPLWMPALEKDIRKIPQKTKVSKKSKKNLSPGSAAAVQPHSASTVSATDRPSSGFSGPGHESMTSVPEQLEAPPLKAFKKKRKRVHKEHPVRRPPSSHKPRQYGWNEYEHGEEAEQDEYVLYIDPNQANFISDLWSILPSKVQNIFQKKVKSETAEEEPLIPSQDYFTIRPDAEDSDLDSDNSSAENIFESSRPRRYSTFSQGHNIPHPKTPLTPRLPRSRESLFLTGTIASFIVSILLFVMSAILESTRRKRYVARADAGAIVGVVFSFISATFGVMLSFARQDDIGWVNRASVILTFAIVCVADGVLVLTMADG